MPRTNNPLGAVAHPVPPHIGQLGNRSPPTPNGVNGVTPYATYGAQLSVPVDQSQVATPTGAAGATGGGAGAVGGAGVAALGGAWNDEGMLTFYSSRQYPQTYAY